MTGTPTRAPSGSRSGPVAVGAVAAFWLLDLVASLLSSGEYSARIDYVSSLAARGSSVWLLGSLCLAAYTLAHLAAGVAMLGQWRTKVAGLLVLLAGLLFLVVTVARAHCADGEAGCGVGMQADSTDVATSLHGVFAGIYAFVMIVAMWVAAVSAIWERGPVRWVALAAVPLFLVGFVAMGEWRATEFMGVWERIWLAANGLWVLLIGLVAALCRPRECHGRSIARLW